MCSDTGPAGGAETLCFQPEANQVVNAAQFCEMHKVRYRHVVPQNMVQSLGQPGSGLLRLIVDTGMTWNIKGTEQLKLLMQNINTDSLHKMPLSKYQRRKVNKGCSLCLIQMQPEAAVQVPPNSV